MHKKSLHIVLNNFTHDNRVLRETHTLLNQGIDIQIFCLHEDPLPLEEGSNNYHIKRFKTFVKKGTKASLLKLLKYAEIFLKMVVAGTKLRPDIVHAHDANGLPIGFLIARLTNAKLIYDSHEFWFDPSNKKNVPPWMFQILLIVEKFLARRTDAVITVSESIAEEMQKNMNLKEKPVLIRNMPHPLKGAYVPLLRQKLGINSDTVILLYQGMITHARGLFLLLDAFAEMKPENTVLVYMGNGVDSDELQESIQQKNLSDCVYYLPAVPPADLLSYTMDATIGVSPILACGLSYEYCLPNKMFEYMQARLALLTSDLKEMSIMIARHQVGMTFRRGDKADLIQKLSAMLTNKEQLRSYRKNSELAACELNWEHEEKVLIDLYKSL